ncbi:MAG: hypothetical protein HRU26_10480 [Psychroserpens sp.]|nr:hypothetical protein [Psychroserpens sp.]
MIDRLYAYRFEWFLFTQIFILFGSLFFPSLWFETWVIPIFFVGNIASGVLLVSKNSRIFKVLIVFLILAIVVFFGNRFGGEKEYIFNYMKLGLYFSFYAVVTVEIIKQVWRAKIVGKNVILGLISGYVSLGLLAFFLCLTIQVFSPEAFSGIVQNAEMDLTSSEELMYFAYITLMTVGYGDILPVTSEAQKAAVFIGLIGQFYLVILTAIVVGKYINQLAYEDQNGPS